MTIPEEQRPEWIVIAQNLWRLAAAAQQLGLLDRVDFAEEECIPENRVYVVDAGAIRDFPSELRIHESDSVRIAHERKP